MGLAFAIDPADGESRADLERLAMILSAWDALAAAYEGGIAKTDDPTTKRELLEAVARLHDERRDDPRKSLDAYQRLSALDPSDIAPLDTMDGLALMLSDWVTLVLVLETKVELLTSDEDRASLYRRIGEAKRDLLEDSAGAIEAYARAAELDPESVYTVDRLIELYEAKGDAKELVDLLRRRVDLTPSDEADTRYDLLLQIAGLQESKPNNPREAIDALRESLDVRPADAAALKGLDRLLRAEQLWPELLENLRLQASGAASSEDVFSEIKIKHQTNRLKSYAPLVVAFANSFYYLESSLNKPINGPLENNYYFKMIMHSTKNYLEITRNISLTNLKLILVAENVVTKEKKIYFN